jgi:cell division topological specificity factor minE
MFENILNFLKNLVKKEKSKESSDTAKERLHLVLMQDRANVSADFLELMKQEIIEVIKKYIDVDEEAIDVHLTNKSNDDGTVGAPALYANIPIVTIKNEARKLNVPDKKEEEEKSKEVKENNQTEKEEEKQQPETENDEKVDVKGEDEKETKVEQRIEETENKDKEKGENEEKATSNS